MQGSTFSLVILLKGEEAERNRWYFLNRNWFKETEEEELILKYKSNKHILKAALLISIGVIHYRYIQVFYTLLNA